MAMFLHTERALLWRFPSSAAIPHSPWKLAPELPLWTVPLPICLQKHLWKGLPCLTSGVPHVSLQCQVFLAKAQKGLSSLKHLGNAIKSSRPCMGLNRCLGSRLLPRAALPLGDPISNALLSEGSAFPSLISREFMGGWQKVAVGGFELPAFKPHCLPVHQHTTELLLAPPMSMSTGLRLVTSALHGQWVKFWPMLDWRLLLLLLFPRKQQTYFLKSF